MMKDVMIDIETLSTQNNAAIIAIGAVAFDRRSGELGPELSISVDLKSCQAAGLHIDAGTVMWWMQQSEQARRKLFSEPRETLTGALLHLDNWLRKFMEKDYRVWGNGTTFDNVLLHSAYRAVGQRAPWSYKQDACYRTMKNLLPQVDLPPQDGVAHDAVSDARNQARHLCLIFQCLQEQFAVAP